MRLEARLFGGLAAFLLLAWVAYLTWSKDATGGTALGLSVLLAGGLAFYASYTGRRIGTQPAEDPLAEVDEHAGPIGFYSPHSWWPLPLAGGCALCALGVVFGLWLLVLGAVLLLTGVVGLLFEYTAGT
jgi:hypothetical protein